MPRALGAARVLVQVLFAATVLGGIGLIGSGLAVDAMGGRLLGTVLYGAAPGVAGWLLVRRAWSGGTRVWAGLVAVQVWLVLGALANIGDSSWHGFTELILPTLILWLLFRAESRDWFRLPAWEREEKPDFSLPHMITWRRDRGQTTVEYVGLLTLVVAIIVALSVGGVGGRIADGFQAAVCSVTGAACPAPGGETVQAGEDGGPGGQGGQGDSGGGSGGQGGSGDPGGEDGGSGGPGGPGGEDGGSGGPGGGSDGGPDSPDGQGNGGDTGGPGGDTHPEDNPEPEAAYDIPASFTDDPGESGDGDGGDGGGEGCSGFWGCTLDHGGQVLEGLFVDGVWGDVTGIVDVFKPDTWSGLADYGGQLGDQWKRDSADAGDKWRNGDYLDALTDWGGASFNTVVTVGDDIFVGDEVRERWNNGEKTRAVTDVVWNVGSLFIPGYNVAKVVGKGGKLGRLGRVADDVADAASDAGEAADRARRAADAGDVEGARKAAREADEAADEAEEQARRTGCAIAFGPGPGPRFRHGGVPGAGTGVLAAGPPGRAVLAEGGCDEEARAKAEEARAKERQAYLDRKRAEEPERARKAEADRKQWPEPERNDTSDPRNYNPPEWAEDLRSPDLGDVDGGDGYWASRDRNPPPNWKNESWLRYQEQITGTVRGREYVVPHPREGKPDVEYDGWDSGRQTFLEAKNGYRSYLSKTDRGTLTESGKQKFLTEARGQVDASGGRAIEWHFSDPEVARAARRAFREEGLPIRVVHTGQKPIDSTRKPEAFD
ncbi:Tox-REase-5 domain-containing protein [Streptomyces sp. SS8]